MELLNQGYPRKESVYISSKDFDSDQKFKCLRNGLREIVDIIETNEDYKYPCLAEACSLFQNFLITLTKLKDKLLPDRSGFFSSKWVDIAIEFQLTCEYVFLSYVKEEYLLSFLPLVPNQLEYTSAKLRSIHQMTQFEFEEFRNLFTLIAMGFIGKLKLLTFCLSLTIISSEKLGIDLSDAENFRDNLTGSTSASSTGRSFTDFAYSSTPCEGFYSDKYANYEFKTEQEENRNQMLNEMIMNVYNDPVYASNCCYPCGDCFESTLVPGSELLRVKLEMNSGTDVSGLENAMYGQNDDLMNLSVYQTRNPDFDRTQMEDMGSSCSQADSSVPIKEPKKRVRPRKTIS
ncbi:hypothetical protein TpMuguga_01g00124 [Theileria parva strain Muguga]|uniref:Uncharacterized protein n=1 Tax=Theileria parva TaxID=5875 RepID=Q4N9J0_THEPA|nr:uncharacterized protein TpMuguga_01g00124 [Theileria parva strain Muguga]EAN33368.1 hypothetical protein TpMuguga_01g00124 [Theileria parva strain Muguga]|eukprot:XP_765651.1 hypothetical protein [Theileria parva strain Muguga]